MLSWTVFHKIVSLFNSVSCSVFQGRFLNGFLVHRWTLCNHSFFIFAEERKVFSFDSRRMWENINVYMLRCQWCFQRLIENSLGAGSTVVSKKLVRSLIQYMYSGSGWRVSCDPCPGAGCCSTGEQMGYIDQHLHSSLTFLSHTLSLVLCIHIELDF